MVAVANGPVVGKTPEDQVKFGSKAVADLIERAGRKLGPNAPRQDILLGDGNHRNNVTALVANSPEVLKAASAYGVFARYMEVDVGLQKQANILQDTQGLHKDEVLRKLADVQVTDMVSTVGEQAEYNRSLVQSTLDAKKLGIKTMFVDNALSDSMGTCIRKQIAGGLHVASLERHAFASAFDTMANETRTRVYKAAVPQGTPEQIIKARIDATHAPDSDRARQFYQQNTDFANGKMALCRMEGDVVRSKLVTGVQQKNGTVMGVFGADHFSTEFAAQSGMPNLVTLTEKGQDPLKIMVTDKLEPGAGRDFDAVVVTGSKKVIINNPKKFAEPLQAQAASKPLPGQTKNNNFGALRTTAVTPEKPATAPIKPGVMPQMAVPPKTRTPSKTAFATSVH